MEIKADLCIGCGQCVIICPVQAIKLIDSIAVIDKNLCVECSICKRNADCPVNAIRSRRLKWPRVIRSPFSDVISTHKLTGIPGRGTEEMKTNDVTNRFGVDEIGFSIEIGRPGVGTHLGNIELFTTKLTSIGVNFEMESPVSALLIDDSGHIKKDIKEERVLSAIIEFKVPLNKAILVLQAIKQIEKNIDTVFTVGVISQVMKNGAIPILDLLTQQGFSVRPNAKVNIGLGKV
ncbi:MAG: 4Fe-4S binding protein [Candidatus Lokiarchaeota archaeon]|nr:4Fe-4S binding protein [Candidatus Lokiarchaeota archaeon]